MSTEYPKKSLGWCINNRRVELRMTWEKVADRASLSKETIFKAAAGRPMRATNKRALEEALYWRPGSIDAINRGEPPARLDPPAPVEDEAGNFIPVNAVRAMLDLARSLRENGADAEAEDAINGAVRIAIKFGVLPEVSEDITAASHSGQ